MKRRELIGAAVSAGALNFVGYGSDFMAQQSREASGDTKVGKLPEVSGLTHYVAEFVLNVSYEGIPTEVVKLGKKSILDGFGLALAGSASEMGAICRRYVQLVCPTQESSTIIGSSQKATPRFAAFANGVSIHADDFDDTQLAVAKDRTYGLLTHPTAPVLPAIFAIAEDSGASGKDLLTAYQAGVEVETKIAEAIAPRHYEDGFHSTGTCGSFGSAAACAKMRGLKIEQTLSAFGIVAAEAAGVRENFGTMTKPFQAGHAAENGVAAADLASLGWTGAEQVLEAKRGFFHAYGGSYNPAAIQKKLGNPWTFASPGVSLKPYPSGSLTHPAMGAMLRLVEKYNLRPGDVEKIDVGTNRNMPNTLIHHRPMNGLQAKFSMEYCVALILLERKASLAHFTDGFVKRTDIQELLQRVNFYVDPIAENAGYDKMTSLISVHMKDGRLLKDKADFAKGSPADPMTFEEAAAKFRGCAEFAKWPTAKTEAIIEAVSALERAANLKKLASLLQA